MSRSEKHVDWCLRKAQKELKETGDHKGLVRIAPDEYEAKEHIKKAEHNLQALVYNKELFSDWSINMGFYTMYHCFLAILSKFGYESKNQECTLSAIDVLVKEKKIDESFRGYVEKIRKNPEVIKGPKEDIKNDDNSNDSDKIMSKREETQYTTIREVEAEKVNVILKVCQDMLFETKGIID